MDLNNLLIGNWELKVGFLEIFGCFKNFFMEFADDVSMIFWGLMGSYGFKL